MHTADWVSDFGEAHEKYSAKPAQNRRVLEESPEKVREVMSWLEGLTQDDWRQYHSDSEVQEIARATLALLMEVAARPVQFRRCACGKLIVRRGDAHNCPYCGRRLEWDA